MRADSKRLSEFLALIDAANSHITIEVCGTVIAVMRTLLQLKQVNSVDLYQRMNTLSKMAIDHLKQERKNNPSHDRQNHLNVTEPYFAMIFFMQRFIHIMCNLTKRKAKNSEYSPIECLNCYVCLLKMTSGSVSKIIFWLQRKVDLNHAHSQNETFEAVLTGLSQEEECVQVLAMHRDEVNDNDSLRQGAGSPSFFKADPSEQMLATRDDMINESTFTDMYQESLDTIEVQPREVFHLAPESLERLQRLHQKNSRYMSDQNESSGSNLLQALDLAAPMFGEMANN